MASYVSTITQAAHHAVTSLLSAAEVKAGKVSYIYLSPGLRGNTLTSA